MLNFYIPTITISKETKIKIHFSLYSISTTSFYHSSVHYLSTTSFYHSSLLSLSTTSFYYSSVQYLFSTSFCHSPYHRQVLLLYLFLLLPEKSNKLGQFIQSPFVWQNSVVKTKFKNCHLSQTYIFVVVGDNSCRPPLVSPPSSGKGRRLSPPILISFTIRIWKNKNW